MKHRLALIALAVAAATASIAALGTPGIGRLYNNILSFGSFDEDITKHIVRLGPRGTEWELKLKTHGASDVYVQESGLAPGGYSGWHTHPGLLVLTVIEGTLALYDANCTPRILEVGDVFTEDEAVHNLVNVGTVNAHVKSFYIVQKGAPRRAEADAPACGPGMGLP
jgi:quercetin dioxygenase-like cupin family protein